MTLEKPHKNTLNFIEEFPNEPSKDLLERRIALVQDIPLISSPDVFEARRRSFKGYSN